ncbi:DUF2218 domain-containing protein [Chromohalobacter sp. TMW 2.2308]|uniref:DUF2218 domain-containing protein n=1 Tax=Chromohalobacter moromii TaxID=2860329 RepID=A0A9X3B656_9GAMM|nr:MULTISPECIES: DUF2218 domain-containing protein [Chromohalobacter]CDQ34595.1 hypothetical protein BN993_04053 [Virgibacillus halodenitrificans]MCK2043553.1 DUF2218 domain-containing protein [Chromohalobacter moromii]MCK2045779.1 DUF2218 domain-containing protein [Chromohalobacter moromii]MCT8505798.1 DUF2218 domain-containing protein [Chromohalobacter moromii]MCT8515211.1 DUF2218 domain-containing protein [Chromohalobacter sp. TMW 2.2271]
MSESQAVVSTTSGSRYINRLCKHWQHKLDVSHDEHQGRVTFDGGVCHMRAEAGALHLQLTAEDAAIRERLEEVVAVHLKRMASREELDIVWQPGVA